VEQAGVVAAGMVLAGREFEVLAPGWVAIQDGRIVEVGSGRPPDQAGPVLDARHGLLTPAFVNAHTHVSDAVMKDRGFGQPFWELVMPPDGLRHRVLRETTPLVLREAVRDTLRHMVSCGTTAFADFREGGLAGVRLLKEAAVDQPIHALALGRFQRSPAQPAGALERNEGALSAEDLAEIDALLEAGDGFGLPSANEVTDEGLWQLGARVRLRDGLLAVHAAEAPGYRDRSLSRTGRGDVDRIAEHLRPNFVVHLTDATETELDRLAAAGIPVVVCPRIQGVMGLGVPRFDRMLERGMLVALGTDNVMLASPDPLRELEYSSRVIRAVRKDASSPSARELLKMATVNGARLLGRDSDLGLLEKGRLADMIVFNLGTLNLRPVHDPVASLVSRAEAGDIQAVLHAGLVVHGVLEVGARL